MDIRFETLRMDIQAQSARTRYEIGHMLTGKGQPPEPVQLSKCKIFKRIGDGKESGHKKWTQEEASGKRALFRHALKRANQ